MSKPTSQEFEEHLNKAKALARALVNSRAHLTAEDMQRDIEVILERLYNEGIGIGVRSVK